MFLKNMLKSKKQDAKKTTEIQEKTTSTIKTIQKSQVSIQNTRTVTYSSSLSYSGTQTNTAASSIRSTALNDVSSVLRALHSSPNLSSSSSSSLARTNTKPRAVSAFEFDAKPFTNLPKIENNYQSTFSRQLTPYASARRLASMTAVPSTVQSTPNKNSNNNLIPTYNINSRNKRRVLIINNIKFLENGERKGAEVDEKEISNLFKEMGFEIVMYRNLTTKDMKSKIKKFSTDKSMAKVDISAVVIMSHGTNDKVYSNFTLVCGTDKYGLEINEIVDEFSGDKCPGMSGKPKLFFFQCCRGNQSELQVDAVPIKPIKKAHADVLIAYSTIPGFYSMRDPKKGTWYIQSICEVFRNHGREFDVEALLKLVDKDLSEKHPTYKQTSAYENRGFKLCYLYPR